jgi:pimeloyl-ACP methyl ester carboxylesterase
MPAAPPLPAFKSEASHATYLAAYEATLREWPVPFEEITAPTTFGPTHIVTSGARDAPPLVLLPSLAATALVWRPNVEALSRRFRILAVDVIGQPGKGAALRPLRSRKDFARWMTDLLDAAGVTRASFVGCSFGGFLALSQASLTPERVDRVVLISPAGTFVGHAHRAFETADPRVVWRQAPPECREPRPEAQSG